MDYNQLDFYLRLNTEKELEFLYDLVDEKILKEKETTIFDPIIKYDYDTDVLNLTCDNIIILRHPRYVYVHSHKHNFIEMCYVYDGNCTQIINGKRVTLQTGEMCILDTNISHAIEKSGENDIIINCLMQKEYFDTSFLSRLSGNDLISNFLVQNLYQNKKDNNYIIFRSSESSKIRTLMTDLICEYFDPSLCSSEIINCYIILIFSELLKTYKQQTKEDILPNNNTHTHQLVSILNYIEENFEDATLSSIAEKFHFHPNYLSYLLKRTTGKSFKEIVYELRLKRACSLLKYTDLSIDDICYKIGASNQNYFYKKFSSTFSMTPQEYRLNYKFTN